MNGPSVFRKAVDGFIIPPRTFMQMLLSAGRGAVGLLDETNRQEFIEKLDKGTINEGVISQATAGPMMMLSLFHDLQNPLFKQHQFDAAEFLEGVGPALERFHNVSGALENQIRKIHREAKKSDNTMAEKAEASENASEEKSSPESTKTKEEEPVVTFSSSFSKDELVMVETNDKSIAALLDHDWAEDIKKDPDSLAAQLSQMVTEELFNIHQLSAKTAFLLQSHRNVTFKEGSCTVNNVALLSARSFLCVQKDKEEDLEEWGEKTDSKYEMIDYDIDVAELKKRKGGVAAQVEVLYDVTQEFVETDAQEGSNSSTEEKPEDSETTIVSVAVMEGWLVGGPDDELRWRLALRRPAVEFPGIQQQ